jgi:cytochrome P450
MQDVAVPYPAQVFLTLFGLPLEDRDRFIAWKDAVIRTSVTTEPSGEDLLAAGELYTYLQGFVERRIADDAKGDDMLSRVIAMRGEADMTVDQILGMSFLFVLAGLDTVTAAAGFCFMHLAERPDLRRQIAKDPSLIPGVVEELLRFELPVPSVPRVTTCPVDVGGIAIPAEASVVVHLAAASHDARTCDSPSELRFDRTIRQLTFGGGVHRCLGSHLARTELRLLIEEWHKAVPDYEIAGEPPSVPWPAGTLVLQRLPLKFVAAP